MKKSLALVLTIIVTLIGTALVGIYDYNIYLNPEDMNGSTLTSKYKSYLSEKTLVTNPFIFSIPLNYFKNYIGISESHLSSIYTLNYLFDGPIWDKDTHLP